MPAPARTSPQPADATAAARAAATAGQVNAGPETGLAAPRPACRTPGVSPVPPSTGFRFLQRLGDVQVA